MSGLKNIALVGGLAAIVAGCGHAGANRYVSSASQKYSVVLPGTPSTQPASSKKPVLEEKVDDISQYSQYSDVKPHPLQVRLEQTVQAIRGYSPQDPSEWGDFVSSLEHSIGNGLAVRPYNPEWYLNMRNGIHWHLATVLNMGRAAYRMSSCRDKQAAYEWTLAFTHIMLETSKIVKSGVGEENFYRALRSLLAVDPGAECRKNSI